MLSRTSARQTRLWFDLMNARRYLAHIWVRFGNLSLNDKWKGEEIWQTGLTYAVLLFQAGSGLFGLPVFLYPAALFNHLLLCFCKTLHMYMIKLWVRVMTALDDRKYLSSSVPSSYIWPHSVKLSSASLAWNDVFRWVFHKHETNDCDQDHESQATARCHTGSPRGTLQPSSPGTPAFR